MLTATNTHSTHTHYSLTVLTVNEQIGEKMKQKILLDTYEFNDKSFWMMFDPPGALDHFVPTHANWESQGVEFTVKELSQDKYQRKIQVWAEGDEKILLLMKLTGV
jgi:hypothetical protein